MIFGHRPSEIAIGCEIRLTAGEIALRAVEVSLRDGLNPLVSKADIPPFRGNLGAVHPFRLPEQGSLNYSPTKASPVRGGGSAFAEPEGFSLLH